MKRVWRTSAIVAAALAGGQVGHLMIYELRYGARAAAVQSHGAHAYFPALVGSVGVLASSAVILSLALIAAARLLSRRAGGRPIVSRPSYLALFSQLSVLQLAIYCVQENGEAWLAGSSSLPLLTPVLAGSFAHIPIAALLAAVLACLLAEVERAVVVLAAPRWGQALFVWHAPVPWQDPRRADPVLAEHFVLRNSAPRAPPFRLLEHSLQMI